MSPNSTAMALLSGFAQGSVQIKGGTVQHISEGNLSKLRKVTIELIQPDGELIGKIENVNFLDQLEQGNESIGEMIANLDTKKDVDSELCSMGKEKQGKEHPTKPSPAAEERKKADEVRKKKEEKERLEKEK